MRKERGLCPKSVYVGGVTWQICVGGVWCCGALDGNTSVSECFRGERMQDKDRIEPRRERNEKCLSMCSEKSS